MSMKKIFLLFFLFNISILFSQSKSNLVGSGFGLGTYIGNFPSQTTLGTKLLYEMNSPFSFFDKIQFHFSAAQKVEKFLPGSYNYDHYSYFLSLGTSGLFRQFLNENFYFQEGLGIIYLNDRSFDDIDIWNFGTILNLLVGTEINKNIDLSLHLDYGLTFNNTNVSYTLIMILVSYKF